MIECRESMSDEPETACVSWIRARKGTGGRGQLTVEHFVQFTNGPACRRRRRQSMAVVAVFYETSEPVAGRMAGRG
jgi:hypothetical protein